MTRTAWNIYETQKLPLEEPNLTPTHLHSVSDNLSYGGSSPSAAASAINPSGRAPILLSPETHVFNAVISHVWDHPVIIKVNSLRGHANSDFTKLETSKIEKP